jgi:uncharacterized repeat protein (TIGR03803 family)
MPGVRQTRVVILALFLAVAIPLSAQTFTALYTFADPNGASPDAGLVQGADGNFYGTTEFGGATGFGRVFRITPGGTVTTLYSFCGRPACTGGASPVAALVQAADGDFYGTTWAHTVFKITPAGTLTTLYSFCSQSQRTDGDYPHAGLVQAASGELYGTTDTGGANGRRTVFKMTPGGTLTTLYSFCSQSHCTDGYGPTAGLVQAGSGDFYGTTSGGVQESHGTVFKITSRGTLTTLYRFCAQTGCPDGENPYAGLVHAANGDFYGTTVNGGAPANRGTVFKITSGGALTTLYSFCAQSGCADGENPVGGLVPGTDGNLYGTTSSGGTYGGTVFRTTPDGVLTTLYTFCSQITPAGCTDGAAPYGALTQATNGDFYGTTFHGGDHAGTVFSVSVGLGPFVRTLPVSGQAGIGIRILGTNLTGATSVRFDGAEAIFKVISSSEIAAYVPADASSGDVQVVTPGGTLSSNVPFRVLP